MIRVISATLLCLMVVGCSKSGETERRQLTEEQKAQIRSFSDKLVVSINGFDFAVIRESWHDDAFKARVAGITTTQKSVFEHLYEEKIQKTIKFFNLAIVNNVNRENGQVSLLKVNHFDYHSELILLLTFEGRFDFFKYRIESINGQPRLVDHYSFMDNIWYSQKVVNILKLSSRYNAYSQERHQANRALMNSDELLASGDSLGALQELYQIPDPYSEGNWLSLRKISLAMALDDSTLSNVLYLERESNPSLYIQYLDHWIHGDSADLTSVYQMLSRELGESEALDSLIQHGSFWN